MVTFLLRRILQLILVLFMGSVAVWAMIYAIPGSPELAIAGADATEEQLSAIRERLGLNRSLPEQYGAWIWNALSGDLGNSLASQKPVTELLSQRLPATFQLIFLAMTIGLLIALPIGLISAWRPRSFVAKFASAYQVLLLAFPSFWLGIIFIWFFALYLRILPSISNYVSIFSEPAQALRQGILPALTLGLFIAAVLMRFVRSAVSAELSSQYVRAASAKGARDSRILIYHVLPNAALPIVTIVGLQIGAFIGGAVVTESVFNYPGIGRLVYVAINNRDYPLVQGVLIFVVLTSAIINMLVDVAYALLDPRIKTN